MLTKMTSMVGVSVACLLAGNCFADNYWSNDVGGDFNVPPKEYNKVFHGYGSNGQKIYNKIDLQNGTEMRISNTPLYDNQGNRIGTAKDSLIGAINGGAGGRDGGIIAGAITNLRINGQTKEVIYAWSVNIEEGGRKSGWVLSNKFTPATTIQNILKQNKTDRLALIEDSLDDADYIEKEVKAVYLPSEAAEWYLIAGRNGNQGKAKYYFTRDGQISGLKNIPDTGSQRYGVAHDTAPVGATFFMDSNVDEVKLSIYRPNGTTPTSYSLKLVWGYFENSAGEQWHSWINSQALKNVVSSNPPVNPPDNPATFVHCANEHATCSLPGPALVRYGANGQFVERNFSGGNVSCTNGVFGDPIRGTLKTCQYKLQ